MRWRNCLFFYFLMKHSRWPFTLEGHRHSALGDNLEIWGWKKIPLSGPRGPWELTQRWDPVKNTQKPLNRKESMLPEFRLSFLWCQKTIILLNLLTLTACQIWLTFFHETQRDNRRCSFPWNYNEWINEWAHEKYV